MEERFSLPFKFCTACYLRKGSDTLLMNYTNYLHPVHKGFFAPPGGNIDLGETPGQNVRREVLEETGIIVFNPTLRGRADFLNEKRTFGDKPAKNNYRVWIYEGDYFDDSKAKATEGELVWIPNIQYKALKVHEGDRVIWDWLEEIRYFEGEIEHIGEKLVRAEIVKS